MMVVIIPYIYIVLYIFSNTSQCIISFVLHHQSPILSCFLSGEIKSTNCKKWQISKFTWYLVPEPMWDKEIDFSPQAKDESLSVNQTLKEHIHGIHDLLRQMLRNHQCPPPPLACSVSTTYFTAWIFLHLFSPYFSGCISHSSQLLTLTVNSSQKVSSLSCSSFLLIRFPLPGMPNYVYIYIYICPYRLIWRYMHMYHLADVQICTYIYIHNTSSHLRIPPLQFQTARDRLT